MQKHSGFLPPPPLRILVVNGGHPAGGVLTEWLRGFPNLVVEGPAKSIAFALALSAGFLPQVVLLDFHGLPVAVDYAVMLFKEADPTPLVFILTHDGSPAMRRRSLLAGVDAVFDKTRELRSLLQALAVVRLEASREQSKTAPTALAS